MTAPEPLLSVGRDCDCGHPLVWHGGEQRCAVYGRHLPPPAPAGVVERATGWTDSTIIRRNMAAPAAGLVDDLDAMPLPAGTKRSRCADYRHLRAVI